MKFMTRAQFREWLDAQTDEARPCAGDGRCPLAIAGGHPHVGIAECSVPGSPALLELPTWAMQVAEELDRRHGGDWEQLTVADIRAALARSEGDTTSTAPGAVEATTPRSHAAGLFQTGVEDARR